MAYPKFLKNSVALVSADSYERALSYSLLKDNFAALAQSKLIDSTPKVAGEFVCRENIWDFCTETIGSDTVIDYLEFGVFQGESIKYFASQFGNPESRFVGFDSFEGLPEDWNASMKEGHFSTAGNLPQTDDTRISFAKGWFQDSLPPFLKSFKQDDKRTVFIHNDSDLYSSTLFVLASLWPSVDSYYLLFDEFFGHESRALYNFLQAFGGKVSFIARQQNPQELPSRVFCKIENRG